MSTIPLSLALYSNPAEVEMDDIEQLLRTFLEDLSAKSTDERIAGINALRKIIHEFSPMSAEPVDCVIWVPFDNVVANDYNPNSVAPPEMELLARSITADGYTQPIVSWERENHYEVVDGFHRHRVGREVPEVTDRIHGFLPLTVIKESRTDRGDRIASTIRHNRARGKHGIDSMADIVVELKRRNWSNKKIGRELGMDPDEVLRLSQITGLAEMFADRDFSEAWEAEIAAEPSDEEITDG